MTDKNDQGKNTGETNAQIGHKKSKKSFKPALYTGLMIFAVVMAYSFFPRFQTVTVEDMKNLPRPSILVPPPATFLMTTEPDRNILGIRRLKVLRPTFRNADGDQASAEALYLTGTKSAELIRKPAEATIKPFPDVTLEEATQGALAADDWGFEAVQSYINKTLGDEMMTEARITDLLLSVEARASEFTRAQITEAVNLIIEAGVRAYNAAYMAPAVIDKDFKLKDGAIGWDFGPENKSPYDNFTRVPPKSDMIKGSGLRTEERDPKGASIMEDGIRNIDEFNAAGLEDGTYRVVILTGQLPQNEEIQYPMGVELKQNGAQMNLIDVRATQQSVPVMRLATEGPGRLADGESAEESGQEQAGGVGSRGHMIVTRVTISDGTFRLNFAQIGLADTYITAILLYPEAATEIFEDLGAALPEYFDRIAPAADIAAGKTSGEIARTPGDIMGSAAEVMGEAPLVIDPQTAYEDSQNGTPTQESQANTPTPTGNQGTDTGNNAGNGSTGGVPDLGSQDPVTGGNGTGGSGNGNGNGIPDNGGSTTSLIAEAGAYAPIALGEDFSVSGCGSTLGGVSTCSLTATGAIELTWLLDGEVIGTGDTLVIQTGDGTPFDLQGEYELTVEVRYDGQVVGPDGITVTLADGSTIFIPGDLSLVSVDTAVIRIIAPIPEPETVALMLTALLMIGIMHRRRRRSLNGDNPDDPDMAGLSPG